MSLGQHGQGMCHCTMHWQLEMEGNRFQGSTFGKV